MEKCNQLLYLSYDLTKYGNKNSFSDTAVAVELLNSAIKGAAYNVMINLKDIDDKKYVISINKKINDVMDLAENMYKKILKIINKELQ